MDDDDDQELKSGDAAFLINFGESADSVGKVAPTNRLTLPRSRAARSSIPTAGMK